MTATAVAITTEGLRTSDRVFWLDGEYPAKDSPRHRSMVGVLSVDDVSLTFDASSRHVYRHRRGSAEIVGRDIFEVLEYEMSRDAGDPDVFWVGWFGYASRADLAARPWGRGPDAVWMRSRNVQLFDHSTSMSHSRVIAPQPPRKHAAPPAWYAEAFGTVQAALRRGDSYEANLTYRESLGAAKDPMGTYLRLRALNPAPYSGLLSHRGTHLLGSSPETFATIDSDRWLEVRPIKGTAPRALGREADERQREKLVRDPRLRSENLIVVDLLRNDLSAVCDFGTVTVPKLMVTESYASVHQLVSTVRGQLRSDISTMRALWSLFPAGSMTGAPKRRTMEILDGAEDQPRGPYAGAFGWICADGQADLGVVIRSLFAGPSDEWQLGTGGAITVRSDVHGEWAESGWKAERVRAAVDLDV